MNLSRLARSMVLASSAAGFAGGWAAPLLGEDVVLEPPRRKLSDGVVVEAVPIEAVQAAEKAGARAARALVRQLADAAQTANRAIILRAPGATAAQAGDGYPGEDPRARMLVLTPGGPLLVETELTIDGAPFRTLREKLLDEALTHADSNKDGVLHWKEALGNPRFFTGRFAGVRNEQQKEQLAKAYDTNGNGVVDRNELTVLMFQQFGGGAFNLQPSFNQGPQVDIRELLDADHNGTISSQELTGAAERLKSRDANDNDLLEFGEIGGAGGNPYYRIQSGGRVAQPTPTAVALTPTMKPAEIHSIVVRRYGEKLSADRFPLVPKLIAALDLNGNGLWDADETAALLALEPHVLLEGNFGKTGDRPAGLTLKSLAPELGDPAKVVQKANDVLTLNLPGLKLELYAPPQPPYIANFEATAKQMLTQLDADKNQYIEVKELNNNQGLIVQFETWDLDGDGKVYLEELKSFYERQYAPQLSQIYATAVDLGTSVFGSLDVSGDGRLSLREMRQAGERMKSYDANQDGQIATSEIPVSMGVQIGRGYNAGYARVPGNGAGGYGPNGFRPASAGAAAGPAWFVRMDRNGDGDVTPREFLGTPAQFQKLDVDGDGFLTREEATEADQPKKSEDLKTQPVTQVQPGPTS